MHNPVFTIRSFKESDFSEWLRLRKVLWDGSSEEEHLAEMREIIDRVETRLILIAETENGGILGFLEASVSAFVEDFQTEYVGYLEGWYVESEFHRGGIGRGLMKTAERWARNEGCEDIDWEGEIGSGVNITAHIKLDCEENSRLTD